MTERGMGNIPNRVHASTRLKLLSCPPSCGSRWELAYSFGSTSTIERFHMARKGDRPVDIRSESERVRPRGHGSPFGEEPSGELRATEKALRERVLVTLQGEPEWGNSEIEVDVRGATVWLKGSVDTINSKYRVEEAVKRVRGVEVIENDLRIRVGEALDEFIRNVDAGRLRDESRRTGRGD